MRFVGLQAVSQLLETFDFFREFAIAAVIVLLLSAIGFDFGKMFSGGEKKATEKQTVPASPVNEDSWHGREHK